MGYLLNSPVVEFLRLMPEADQVADVVTGTFIVLSVYVNVLFDLGASCSFFAKSRVNDLELGDFEHVSYIVAVPAGNCIVVISYSETYR